MAAIPPIPPVVAAAAPTYSPAQVAQINAARDSAYNNKQNVYNAQYIPVPGNVPVTPAPMAPVVPANTMSGTNLGTGPTTTYSTYNAPSTAADGLTTTALSAKDAIMANLSKQNDVLTTEDATSKDTQKSILDQLGLEEENRQSLYEKNGVNQDQKDIDDINADIDSTNASFKKQLESVAANSQGRTDGGVDVVGNALKQQQASVIADKTLLLAAKTQNLNTAKGIIDSQVDSETADLKTQLQGLQYFYTQNESNLSDNKKTILQNAIQDADNEYQDAKDTRTQINQLKLTAAQNGAPLSVLQKIGAATTVDDATTALGSYASDPLDREYKQAQIAKEYASANGTSAGTFTKTQLNNGAANAGIPIADFGNLTSDDKNYFINGYSGFEDAMKQVNNGDATIDDLKQSIDAAPLSDDAKNILYEKAGIDTSTATAAKPGFWSGVGSAASGAMGFVGSLFGGG